MQHAPSQSSHSHSLILCRCFTQFLLKYFQDYDQLQTCWPSQPLYNHPSPQTVLSPKGWSSRWMTSSQASRINLLKKDIKSLLREEKQVFSWVGNPRSCLLHHHKISDGPCSSPCPMNFHQNWHMENFRENDQQWCQEIYIVQGKWLLRVITTPFPRIFPVESSHRLTAIECWWVKVC